MHGSMTHLPSLHTHTLRHNLQEALDTAQRSSTAIAAADIQHSLWSCSEVCKWLPADRRCCGVLEACTLCRTPLTGVLVVLSWLSRADAGV